ncbi:hypothetical protein MMC25_007750 [Agyrium rufum]|nr:hypothetical protein [Agyrium rufum]
MDGLSVAASIIAVLHLTVSVIEYLKDVKDAPKACQQCYLEAGDLNSLLVNLLYHLNQSKGGNDGWYTAVRALDVDNGPLDQYKGALLLLQSKVEAEDGLRKIRRRLVWKFTKEESQGILMRMERLKSLVTIALEMDHFKLSLAIKTDTASIQANLIPLQASATSIEAGIDKLYVETRSVKDNTATIRDALPPLQASTASVQSALQLQKHQAMMEWLSPTDFLTQQNDIISRRQQGTAQWFLNSDSYKQWLHGPDKTLFCPGIPGAGKTIIAAVAIDHLCQMSETDDRAVACVFCSYKSQASQGGANLFAALLRQLVQGRPSLASPVELMHQKHARQNSRPTLNEILEALQSVCAAVRTVWIIVDALDEYADADRMPNRLVDELFKLQVGSDVKLLFTSRDIPDITEKFQSTPTIQISASAEDVTLYVTGQLPRLPKCIQRDEGLQRQVQSSIVNAVDGMFLLARLHVDSLLDKRNKHKVQSTLNRFSKGSDALDEAYGKAIRRIDGQLPEDRLLAKRAICWISYAQRPLTTQELCCALAIEPGDKAPNTDNMYDIEEIVSVCVGLVAVDEECKIIRLTHYTTQEYFEQIRSDWYPHAQEEIGAACLTYMLFDTFQNGICVDRESFKRRLADHPLLDYVASNWVEHVRPVQASPVLSDRALTFLCNGTLIDNITQVEAASLKFWPRRKAYTHYSPEHMTGLHLCAKHGLTWLAERIISGGRAVSALDVDAFDSHGRTPLSFAAANGHQEVVRLLLNTGKVEIDLEARYGGTPLFFAAARGHEAVVRLLLDIGKAEVKIHKEYGGNPLASAAENGHEAIVRLLLDVENVDVDAQYFGATPALLAAISGHEAIVRLLLETGKVDVKTKDYRGWTLFSEAVGHGQEALIKVLLATGQVEVNSKDIWGSSPLHKAAEEGNARIVKLLLDTGKMELDIETRRGVTPLSIAAHYGHEAVVRLLLDTEKVDLNSQSKKATRYKKWKWRVSYERPENGQTPLILAATEGHEAVVRLLLDTGKVDIDMEDDKGWTAMLWAKENGHEAVVELLQSYTSK